MVTRHIAKLILLLAIFCAYAEAQQNPGRARMEAFVLIHDPNTRTVIRLAEFEENVPAGQGNLLVYHPDLPGYDLHKTSPGNRNYGHAHSQVNYPWVGREAVGDTLVGPTMAVTAEMVNEASLYDNPLHTIVFNASCGMNCHGFTMSKAHWVMPDTLLGGASRIIADEYTTGSPPDTDRFFMRDGSVTSEYFHSFFGVWSLVDYWGIPIWIRTAIFEKFNSGPLLTAVTTGETASTTIQRKHK